jgi:hypothetical protein
LSHPLKSIPPPAWPPLLLSSGSQGVSSPTRTSLCADECKVQKAWKSHSSLNTHLIHLIKFRNATS